MLYVLVISKRERETNKCKELHQKSECFRFFNDMCRIKSEYQVNRFSCPVIFLPWKLLLTSISITMQSERSLKFNCLTSFVR